MGSLCGVGRQGRSTRVSVCPGRPGFTLCSPCPWPDLQVVGNSYSVPFPRPETEGKGPTWESRVSDLSTPPLLQQKLTPVAWPLPPTLCSGGRKGSYFGQWHPCAPGHPC